MIKAFLFSGVLATAFVSSISFAGGMGCFGTTANGNQLTASFGFDESNPNDLKLAGVELRINDVKVETTLLRGEKATPIALAAEKDSTLIYFTSEFTAMAVNTSTGKTVQLECYGD